MEFKINFAAVLVAVLANFILGFIWYTPLFGKIWGREMGYASDKKPDSKVLIKGMAFMLIGNFLFVWVLAHNMTAWTFVPEVKAMGALPSALNAAIFTWIGFFLPRHLGSTVWEKKSWTLFFINAGYDLAALLVVSLILAYWV